MTREQAFQRFMDAQDVARVWSRSHAEKPPVLLDWLRDTEHAWRETTVAPPTPAPAGLVCGGLAPFGYPEAGACPQSAAYFVWPAGAPPLGYGYCCAEHLAALQRLAHPIQQVTEIATQKVVFLRPTRAFIFGDTPGMTEADLAAGVAALTGQFCP